MAFNPRQARDRNGRWVRRGGGGGSKQLKGGFLSGFAFGITGGLYDPSRPKGKRLAGSKRRKGLGGRIARNIGMGNPDPMVRAAAIRASGSRKVPGTGTRSRRKGRSESIKLRGSYPGAFGGRRVSATGSIVKPSRSRGGRGSRRLPGT